MTEKHGQIAHLDDDRANSSEDNLAFLCLEHHSVYDTTTSQHKGYTIQEAKKARADLYGAVEQGLHLSVTAIRGQGREADRKTLADIIRKLGKETIPFLRIVSFDGCSFPLFKTDPAEEFLVERGEPEHEFIDVDIERARRDLLTAMRTFVSLLQAITRPVPGQHMWNRVPIELLKDDREQYFRAVGRLDGAAAQVCNAYDHLVRDARRRLET